MAFQGLCNGSRCSSHGPGPHSLPHGLVPESDRYLKDDYGRLWTIMPGSLRGVEDARRQSTRLEAYRSIIISRRFLPPNPSVLILNTPSPPNPLESICSNRSSTEPQYRLLPSYIRHFPACLLSYQCCLTCSTMVDAKRVENTQSTMLSEKLLKLL